MDFTKIAHGVESTGFFLGKTNLDRQKDASCMLVTEQTNFDTSSMSFMVQLIECFSFRKILDCKTSESNIGQGQRLKW